MKNKRRPMTQSNAAFATADISRIQRSTFVRPSSLKTTFNCGELVPIYIDEVLPGDTFKIDLQFLSRLSTPLNPTMDDINMEIYAFFVPNRLVWDGWQTLMGENNNGPWNEAHNPALVPCFGTDNPGLMATSRVLSKRIGDYYGLPVGMIFNPSYTSKVKNYVSALPFRGYGLIWNEWFRDENLQAPLTIQKGNTENGNGFYGINHPLLKVNKFHDYFTSALPAPLKGDSPLLPIELNKLIPVITGDTHIFSSGGRDPLRFFITGEDQLTPQGKYNLGLHTGSSGRGATACADLTDDGRFGTYSDVIPTNLYADGRSIGNLNSTTVSELRTLFQIQKLLERDARGGTRYRELLLSHFGVDAGDYRLQRPEFLGKYVTRVGMQSVPQTSASVSGQSPQGNLAAYSLTVGSSHIIDKSFVEHGFIHIFAVARQVKTYQQGLEKFWSRRERFDFYWPELSHISEQPIYNREIYALPVNDENGQEDLTSDYYQDIFGYQEAWADYRYKPNHVTGQMRSNSVASDGSSDSLDIWHYADNYSADNPPVLSDGWITDNSAVNVDRTLAIPSSTDNQIRMDIAFRCIATRPMPVKSIPGLVDHF